jgi:hypothetical protein
VWGCGSRRGGRRSCLLSLRSASLSHKNQARPSCTASFVFVGLVPLLHRRVPQVELRGHRIKAAWFALSLGALAVSGQDQKSDCARRNARNGGGLGTVKEPRGTPSPEMLLASELGREGRILEETDVVQLLKSAIEREGGQGAFARRHIIDRAYLNQMLNGKNPINSAVMKALGLRKVYAPE